jgi:hypothetical protein
VLWFFFIQRSSSPGAGAYAEPPSAAPPTMPPLCSDRFKSREYREIGGCWGLLKCLHAGVSWEERAVSPKVTTEHPRVSHTVFRQFNKPEFTWLRPSNTQFGTS